jgi:hypothetical protein
MHYNGTKQTMTTQTTLAWDVHVSRPVTDSTTTATWPGPDTRSLRQATLPFTNTKRTMREAQSSPPVYFDSDDDDD